MLRRMIVPALRGVVGVGILLSLGFWQVARLHWKEAILADMSARLVGAPGPMPASPMPGRDDYRPVALFGHFTGEHIDVLASRKNDGAGLRVIEVFVTTDGRRIMVDRGFLPEEAKSAPRDESANSVQGNLHWPKETDSFTPPPDASTGLWFARDVPPMAAKLAAEPVLLVASRPTGGAIEAMPVDTSTIPNDHAQYAFTWFSLAAAWLGMTVYLLWRIRQRTV